MNGKIRSLFFICLGLLFGMSAMYVYNNFIADKKGNSNNKTTVEYGAANENSTKSSANYSSNQSIDQLTEEKTVINYVKQNHKLPDYYITKNEARKQGWNPSKGNLCDVLPGRAIGGDNSATEKETSQKVKNILKPMLITTAETETPTELYSPKMAMFIYLKIIIKALKSSRKSKI